MPETGPSKDLHGHRGRSNDPLYRVRRTMHTGSELLTDAQTRWLRALFTDDEHVQAKATWGIYQRMIGATANPTAPAAGS